jgi:hypothetical protein
MHSPAEDLEWGILHLQRVLSASGIGFQDRLQGSNLRHP